MRKRVHLKSGRERENAGDFLGTFILGIDDHGKTELLTKIRNFLAVIGRADTGNCRAVTDHLGNRAAEKIQLVGIGYGNQKVCVFDAGFHLNRVAGAVSANAHNVIGIGE